MGIHATERVKRHRAIQKANGMQAVQIWVPDTRRPEFIEACRRQSQSLRHDPQEPEMLDWMEFVSDTKGWQ
jgi:Protein  of unknown function (DUF3018)